MADPLASLGVAAIPATPPPSTPTNADPLASLGVPANPMPAPQMATPTKEAFPGETPNGGVARNLAVGFSKEANKTAIGVKNLANKVLPSSMQIPALPVESTDLESHGIAQGAGGLTEGAAEFLVGDEAAKALSEISGASKYLKTAAGWSQYLRNSPAAARAIEALGTVARESLVGGVQGGVKGAVPGATESNVMSGAAEGALSTAAGSIAGQTVGGLAKYVPGKVAEEIEESGNRAANSIFRAKGDRSFLYGKNPGDVIADEQIPVTNSIFKLKQSVGDAMNKLDGMVKAKLSDPAVASQKVDVAQIANGAVDDALKELQGRQGITNRKGIVEALNSLRPGMHDADGNLIARVSRNDVSPTAAQEYKKNIGKSTKWNGLGADPEIAAFVNDTRKAIYGRLNDAVEAAAPGTKALNARFSNAIEANHLLEQRINREEMNDLGYGKLVKKLGTKGAMLEAVTALGLGHPIAAVPGAVVAANEAARTTAARIMRARAAEGAADLVRGMAPTIGRMGSVAGKARIATSTSAAARTVGRTSQQGTWPRLLR